MATRESLFKPTTVGGVLTTPVLRGASAYELAVKQGYEGTLEEWLESLIGENGKSAYELAKELNPSIGTLEEWLDSLKYDHSDEFAEFVARIQNLVDSFNESYEDKASSLERYDNIIQEFDEKNAELEKKMEDVMNTIEEKAEEVSKAYVKDEILIFG